MIEILNSDGTRYAVEVTDENGHITLTEIPAGTYTFFETYCPEQYVLNTTQFTFTVDEYGNITGETGIANEPTKLVITKTDSMTKERLIMSFNLLDRNGNPVKLAKQPGGAYSPSDRGEAIFLTDNGSAEILYLPKAEYTIVEANPAGYAAIEPMKINLTDEHSVSAPLAIDLYNAPLVLRIEKFHAKTNEPLTGAGFAVIPKGTKSKKPLTFTIQKDGVYRYDPNGAETIVRVDKHGIASVTHIPSGDYVLEEREVPKGFFPAPPVNITVTSDHTYDMPLVVKVPNEPFVKLGFDDDRWNFLIAGGLIAAAGVCTWIVLRKKRKTNISQKNKYIHCQR